MSSPDRTATSCHLLHTRLDAREGIERGPRAGAGYRGAPTIKAAQQAQALWRQPDSV